MLPSGRLKLLLPRCQRVHYDALRLVRRFGSLTPRASSSTRPLGRSSAGLSANRGLRRVLRQVAFSFSFSYKSRLPPLPTPSLSQDILVGVRRRHPDVVVIDEHAPHRRTGANVPALPLRSVNARGWLQSMAKVWRYGQWCLNSHQQDCLRRGNLLWAFTNVAKLKAEKVRTADKESRCHAGWKQRCPV